MPPTTAHEVPVRAGDATRVTTLRVELDCTVCLTATVDRLEQLPEVAGVEVHTAAGCLLVEHRGPVGPIVDTVEVVGHRIEVASNGEAVMAAAVVDQVDSCCHRRPGGAPTVVEDDTCLPS
jgi:hypothetical protein